MFRSVSLHKKNIFMERKIIEKDVENVRAKASLSLYKKNDIQGTKNQRFLYLGTSNLCMEKKRIRKQGKQAKIWTKMEKDLSCRIDFLYRENPQKEISPEKEKICIEKKSVQRNNPQYYLSHYDLSRKITEIQYKNQPKVSMENIIGFSLKLAWKISQDLV